MQHQLLGWAKNKNGETVCVSDVPRGKTCNCFCPYCDAPLIARKGQYRKPHFAHAKGMECKHGYEASVHLLAKEVFQQTKTLCLPRFGLRHENRQGTEKILIHNSRRNNNRDCEIHDDELIDLMKKNANNETCYAGEQKSPITFDEVLVEQVRGDVKPDAIAIKDSHELYVEFLFSHAIDNEKYHKLVESKVSCVEIDLSNIQLKNNKDEDFASMEKFLKDKSNIRWIYYPKAIEKIRATLINLKKVKKTQYKNHRTIKPAPIKEDSNKSSINQRFFNNKNDSISLFHENCEYILNRVEEGGENVCEYVRKLRTIGRTSWQDVHEGDREECKMCPYHRIGEGNKVFCIRYTQYL